MNDILKTYMSKFTTLTDAEQQAIVSELVIKPYKKGTILLRQGEVPASCYFVLQGCVRQYTVEETGKEVTSNFYIEEQAIANLNHHRQDQSSAYSLACLEDCLLVVGDFAVEGDMYSRHTQLESMTRRMIEQSFGQVQEELAAFIASTPEERYRSLLGTKPNLTDRVPQHQLASYLGMTPESLSRIKKRVSG